MDDPQNVIQSLIAIRLKLKRSIVLRANIIYEVGSNFTQDLPCFPLRSPHSFPCVGDGQRKGTKRY